MEFWIYVSFCIFGHILAPKRAPVDPLFRFCGSPKTPKVLVNICVRLFSSQLSGSMTQLPTEWPPQRRSFARGQRKFRSQSNTNNTQNLRSNIKYLLYSCNLFMFYDVIWCSMMFYVFLVFLVSFCQSVPSEFLRYFFVVVKGTLSVFHVIKTRWRKKNLQTLKLC